MPNVSDMKKKIRVNTFMSIAPILNVSVSEKPPSSLL